jgi:hypothetical protein
MKWLINVNFESIESKQMHNVHFDRGGLPVYGRHDRNLQTQFIKVKI